MKGKRWLLVALATVCGSLVLGAASAAPPADHALLALNILPPGEGANAPDLTSQLPLYDGLTPLRGDVTSVRPDQVLQARDAGARRRQADPRRAAEERA